jgi:imidazolonepropionase-like amidohydrolase
MSARRILTGLGALAMAAAPLSSQATIAIRGGTVHTLAGPDVANGTVVIQGGVITAVGAGAAIPAGATVIDASGMHVYPGLFDAISGLGLTEIGAVSVTNDQLELGTFNPHLFGMTAVHPASEHIPVARANGVTHTVAAPRARAGGIGGQGSLMHLNGWTIEEMLIQPSVGMMVQWPSLRARRRFGGGGTARQQSFRDLKRTYDARVDSLAQWLGAARQYQHAVAADASTQRDLRLEALRPVLDGQLPLLVIANSEREIRDAIAFAEEHEVRIVVLQGRSAWKVAELLAEKDVPVILSGTQALPNSENESYDEKYAQPGKLHAAGVRFAIATFGASNSRTVPYEAGTAVPYGLPEEEALRAITRYPAEILGVGDRLGTIEEGKIANLIVTDGSPLEIQTQVLHVVIAGGEASLDNKHLELYEKYRARPKQ